jgi:tRNA nucleotidyltransferase (CCA-adding enzyme)
MAADETTTDGQLVLARLRELPGGRELLAVAREHGGGVELVGGAVRDILLGSTPRELDTLVEGDVQAVLDRLAELLDATVTVHERFGTALVSAPAVRIDLVRARAESYGAPGALPEVWPGTLEQDLRRRDFTVNAIAVALDGDRPGELRTVEHALGDLVAGRLRVLHDRSFLDDPTRLLRIARYAARLGFEPEGHTAELAARALAGGALSTVSGARIGAELRLALAEPEPLDALAEMARLGVLSALHPRLHLRESLVGRALELLPSGDGRPDLLVLASLVLPLILSVDEEPGGQARALIDRWQFHSADRDRVVAAAVTSARLVSELPAIETVSELHAVANGAPLEGVALAGAIGGPECARAAERWLLQTRNVRLAITGEDLLGAGVPQGPEIGRRLDAALALLLDGRLDDTRDAQLLAALEARV